MDVIYSSINLLNTSPYIVALAMFLMNLSSRFLANNLSPAQEYFLTHNPVVKILVIYIIVFMASRNVIVTLIMGTFLYLLIYVFLNENSRFSLLPRTVIDGFTNFQNDREREEYEKAKKTISDYEQKHAADTPSFDGMDPFHMFSPMETGKQNPDIIDSYYKNLQNLAFGL